MPNFSGHSHDRDREKSYYKRPFDLCILVSSHVLLLPLWLLLWTLIPLLVWLYDRGPVFFKQERMGKYGQTFIILKFRTMDYKSDNNGPLWTTEQDTRVTLIGKFLRKTALDELPGLISIWKGDMSFVGPRALETEEHKLLENRIRGFDARLQVSPGLTGLAQVKDKFDVAQDKLRYDLEYIEKMNIGLDLVLLFMSLSNTFLAKWDRRGGKTDLLDTSSEDEAGHR